MVWRRCKKRFHEKKIDCEVVGFSDLLEKVAKQNPKMRIRFSTSNPQDMKDDVLKVISKYENLCNYIHLPVQSGSSKILELMNRGHTREWYLNRINAINKKKYFFFENMMTLST